MFLKPVTLWEGGVGKPLLITHSYLLHDPFRGLVGNGCKRIELPDNQFFPRVGDTGRCGLGGESSVPVSVGKAPTDFPSGRERHFKAETMQADIADECAGILEFNREKAMTAIAYLGGDALHKAIRLLFCQKGWKIPHHSRVPVHFRENGFVFRFPIAENQPGRFYVNGVLHEAKIPFSVVAAAGILRNIPDWHFCVSSGCF